MKHSKETGEPLNPLQALIGEYYGIATEKHYRDKARRGLIHNIPEEIQEIINGEDPTAAYYDWLIDQYNKEQEGRYENVS